MILSVEHACLAQQGVWALDEIVRALGVQGWLDG